MKSGKKVFCNICGREIISNKGIIREGVFEANHEWGYFSEKDLEIHSFDFCEECYDKLMQHFQIPVTIRKRKVVLE